ncbi:methyltransferase [Methanoculleus sp. FWC-SCC1]|uniref:Methyltransferase n=1 Tax=Methanoculleus frigidifontis TaxID=2584085 RepID=A0ABT8MBE0_9EURY|nr:HemK2/MTQ2 family protein methyltransferase [Methanoculleus sp. FWC-SCC1]MDN7025247.1 methyltransferase [Methanoculleus sp. FWC-SCC1]
MHDQVYQPEADTFLLLRAALREVRPTDRVLEVGTGSGRIAAAVLETGARVVGTDINPYAVLAARSCGVETVRTDLAAGFAGPFDLVVFNPPYLPTVPEDRFDDWLEYALDGGPDGRRVIERFVRDLDRVLAPYGRLLLLVSSLTDLDAVRELLGSYGFIAIVVDQEGCEGETLYVLRAMRDLCRVTSGD